MIAHSRVDVRRHVREMAFRGRQLFQTRGTGQPALRMRRGFNGVNVIMICAEMIRVAFQNRFEQGHNLFSVLGRFAVGAPKMPRMQIHHALGVERCCVEIVRITRDQLAHRVFVSPVKCLKIDRWVV